MPSSNARDIIATLFAFRPVQVTLLLTSVYIALFVALLSVHNIVPPARSHERSFVGINQSQAWSDLQHLSADFHPFNSRKNEAIREWLIDRVEALVESNTQSIAIARDGLAPRHAANSSVVVFDDLQSNSTFLDKWRNRPWTCYIESQNVIVYVRGIDDEDGAWWTTDYQHKQGILVNAHYDSVSTGYGATDDGCGVITILQLISHFTVPGNQPRRGIIFLLNNGEEDGLYGAHAFSQHPTSSFPGVFLNLEGAGAGGRATLFRSTDAEVTSLYASSPHPFGTVVSADGFKRGLVKSGTDYSVFTEDLKIGGLDVAFMAPRSRYHTNQDSAEETSRDSLWHMLSGALSTSHAMQDLSTGGWHQLVSPHPPEGVWFDIFGAGFAVMSMQVFAGLCISLLVLGPLSLAAIIGYLIYDKRWYPLTRKHTIAADDDETVRTSRNLHGLTRAIVALVLPGVALLGLADLLNAANPYIVYRSPYVVWAAFLSGFSILAWSILRLADHIRPTELSRWYTTSWIYIMSWFGLAVATHGCMANGMGSGYFVLIYNLSAFLALLLCSAELFSLPRTQDSQTNGTEQEDVPAVPAEQASSTERTPLLSSNDQARHTFTGHFRQNAAPQPAEGRSHLGKAGTPAFNQQLPSWTWLVHMLLLVPINVILVGQIGLFITSALHQTPADGNDPYTIYLLVAGCSILLLLPAFPFLHKLRSVIPAVLAVSLLGSLLWIFLASPFDREARLKYYFIQQVDLSTGVNTVSLSALAPHLQTIIAEVPSAAGQQFHCLSPNSSLRLGLSTCSWQGIAPECVQSSGHSTTSTSRFGHWVDYNASVVNQTSASFHLVGRQSKNCRITFDTPIQGLTIEGAAVDVKHDTVAEHGSTQVRLFSRDWAKHFSVNVSWHGDVKAAGQTGRIGCMWAEAEAVPALRELKKFEPVWSAVTKHDDGLVEGWYDWHL